MSARKMVGERMRSADNSVVCDVGRTVIMGDD